MWAHAYSRAYSDALEVLHVEGQTRQGHWHHSDLVLVNSMNVLLRQTRTARPTCQKPVFIFIIQSTCSFHGVPFHLSMFWHNCHVCFQNHNVVGTQQDVLL